jgi:DNA-binding XRE family transcriptional regulator
METSSGYTFGELLKQYRARANMSQTALAEKLGVSRLTISNWEVGNTLPRRHVKEIADALLLNEHDTNQLIAASLGHTLVPPWPPADSADAPEDNRPLRSDEIPQVSSDHPPQWKWNRQRMLEKVHTILIKEGLEKLVSSTALIPLGFHEKPDAVMVPGKPISQEGMKQSLHGWPQGTDIGQVYDDTIGELLILGEAGSGKTILLLQLTRILLDRAKRDENHPIPVVFNLSSWAVRRLPISRWLVEVRRVGAYGIPV